MDCGSYRAHFDENGLLHSRRDRVTGKNEMKLMTIHTEKSQREDSQKISKARGRRNAEERMMTEIPREEILVIESFLLNEVLEILAEE